MPRGKVLVIDDDPDQRLIIEKTLETEGLEVRSAPDGHEGIDAAREWEPDLVILDIMMPRLDGIEACRLIREANRDVRIFMLTALGDEQNKVSALDSGADEYLTKPVTGPELSARVRAVFRRLDGGPDNETLAFGDVHIDAAKREVKIKERPLSLTTKEFDILLYFARHPNEPLNREFLLDKFWGLENDVSTRRIDNFILNLRKLVEPDPSNPRYIITLPRLGYKFTPGD